MHRRGLVQGHADGTFAPNDSTTRGQIVTILYRLASGENPNVVQGEITLSNVSQNQYYADYAEAISWAELKNILHNSSIINGVLTYILVFES